MKDNMTNANRCIMCKNARCSMGCPVSTAIPKVIELYKEGRIEEAGRILFENNPLSLICSMVCPHEDNCMGGCVLGIKGEPVEFPAIEREVSEAYLRNLKVEDIPGRKGRVAIIGSGPAGLTLALILAGKGYKITIFEKESKLGGVLRYGIPEFRLSDEIMDLIEERILDMGVKVRYNELIGPVNNVDKLLEDGYDAVFIGTGVGNPRPLSIKGETLGHVHYAINYLKSPASYRLGKKVVVIGAGNVAMDAARTAKRQGAEEVHIVYRRGVEDMKATKAEIEETKEDGVLFTMYRSPLEIVDEGLMVNKTENIVSEDGSMKLVTLEDSEYLIECDSVIVAISQNPKDNIVRSQRDIETNKWGLVIIDDEGHTTRKGVFASGDVVTGAKTVVDAVAHTKIVAGAIEEYIG